jgi:hypothetical protein
MALIEENKKKTRRAGTNHKKKTPTKIHEFNDPTNMLLSDLVVDLCPDDDENDLFVRLFLVF